MDNNAMDNRKLLEYSPLALAFLGDTVWSMLAREHILRETGNSQPKKLHDRAVEKVHAGFQASVTDFLLSPMCDGLLTDEEMAVLKRGLNSTPKTIPKIYKPETYIKATALESLFGYLWLSGKRDVADAVYSFVTEKIRFL
jgi:ribonuclease-3 family protein